MKPIDLLKEDKYAGCFVALRSFSDSTVLAFGSDPQEVELVARGKGVNEPVVVYVPEAGTHNIY